MTGDRRAVEIVPGRLFALGGVVPLDGRVSWVAADATGHLPINCYLLLGSASALLIDTGACAHRAQVIDQLRSVLPAGSPLSVVLTRTELDCALNLPAIESEFLVNRVICTGGTFTIPRSSRVPVERLPLEPGTTTTLEVAPGIDVLLHAPLYRLLPTIWVHDLAAHSLFTSDAFGHLRHIEADRLPAGDGDELPGIDAIRSDVLAKFDWIAHTNPDPIASDIRAVFVDGTIDVIAPTFGRVISGSRLVTGVVERLVSVITELPR
jgi:hypothetical protein